MGWILKKNHVFSVKLLHVSLFEASQRFKSIFPQTPDADSNDSFIMDSICRLHHTLSYNQPPTSKPPHTHTHTPDFFYSSWNIVTCTPHTGWKKINKKSSRKLLAQRHPPTDSGLITQLLLLPATLWWNDTADGFRSEMKLHINVLTVVWFSIWAGNPVNGSRL